MKISVTYEIEEQRIQDLLCNAFEGGSNYWYQIEKYNYPEGLNGRETEESLHIKFAHLELPFKGGSLIIKDCEENSSNGLQKFNQGKDYTLDIKAIRQGLNIMAEKHTRHFADFISENDDAVTGDVFLQCCLFGELIYG